MLKITAIVVAAAAGIVAFGGGALAQPALYGRTPSTSDFEICNRDAEINRGSSVSASPGTGTLAQPNARGAGFGAAGGATGSPASGAAAGSAAGATGGTGSLSGGSTLGGDESLRGLAAGNQSDPSYQQAY